MGEKVNHLKMELFHQPALNVIDVYANLKRVGDFLHLTPLMNATFTRLILEDNEDSRRIAILGLGMGEIKFISKLPYQMEWSTPGRGIACWARRLLDVYWFIHHSCLPKIRLSTEELLAGYNLIKDYKNPIAIRDIQGYNNERNPPPGLMQRIVDSNPEYTFLNFGISSQHLSKPYQISVLHNVITINDLPLRIMAACYYWVRRYIGVDTGNYHLMLSVGGKCDVWVPPVNNTIGYNDKELWYPQEEWGLGTSQVINYIRMDESNPSSIIGLKYL